MQPGITVRAAKSADLDAVIALIRGLAEFEKLPGPDQAAAERLKVDFTAQPPRFELWVAEQQGEICGYALYFMTYSTFLARPSLYLEDLYIRPESRGRGAGELLLRTLARIARDRGCARYEWTVLDWNVRAQTFYQSLGARMLAEWNVCRVDGEALENLASG